MHDVCCDIVEDAAMIPATRAYMPITITTTEAFKQAVTSGNALMSEAIRRMDMDVIIGTFARTHTDIRAHQSVLHVVLPMRLMIMLMAVVLLFSPFASCMAIYNTVC